MGCEWIKGKIYHYIDGWMDGYIIIFLKGVFYLVKRSTYKNIF